MEQRVALLRGINLGRHKRVAMPALRELLAKAGFEQVRTSTKAATWCSQATPSRSLWSESSRG